MSGLRCEAGCPGFILLGTYIVLLFLNTRVSPRRCPVSCPCPSPHCSCRPCCSHDRFMPGWMEMEVYICSRPRSLVKAMDAWMVRYHGVRLTHTRAASKTGAVAGPMAANKYEYMHTCIDAAASWPTPGAGIVIVIQGQANLVVKALKLIVLGRGGFGQVLLSHALDQLI